MNILTMLLGSDLTAFLQIPARNVMNNHKLFIGYSITDETLTYNPLRLKG
jgi:hypothetical protein